MDLIGRAASSSAPINKCAVAERPIQEAVLAEMPQCATLGAGETLSRASRDIKPGTCWRQVILGSEAVYEVLAMDGAHVVVEVRQAPGLAAGTRVRLTLAAVAAMERLDPGPGEDPTFRS